MRVELERVFYEVLLRGFGVGFLVTLFLTPIVSRLALRFGVLSRSSPEVEHPSPVPLWGGLAIVAGTLTAMALGARTLWWLSFGTASFCVLGMIDDWVELTPLQKLLWQMFISAIVATFGPRLRLTQWAGVDRLVYFLWVIVSVNAYNLIDGLDGLSSGIGVIGALAIVLASLAVADFRSAHGAAALTGSLSAFLPFNFHPASIFMGDAGALAVGFALATLALRVGCEATNSQLTRLAFPVFVMALPLLDTCVVSVIRLATNRAISVRGHDHSHHRLLLFGLDVPRASALEWSLAGLGAGAALAIFLSPGPLVPLILPFPVICFSVLAFFFANLAFEATPPGQVYGYVQGLARLILDIAYRRRLIEMALDMVVSCAAYSGAVMLRLDFNIDTNASRQALESLPYVIVMTMISLRAVGVYRSIWRHFDLADLMRIAEGSLLSGIMVATGSKIGLVLPSMSIAFIYAFLLFNILAAIRYSFKLLRRTITSIAAARGRRFLVIGANEMGEMAARYLSEISPPVNLVGFIDDDPFKLGKRIQGSPVLGSTDSIEKVAKEMQCDGFVVATADLDAIRLKAIENVAQNLGIELRVFSLTTSSLVTPSAPSPESASMLYSSK